METVPATWKNSLAVFQNVTHRVTMWSSFVYNRYKNLGSHKNFYRIFHGSIIIIKIIIFPKSVHQHDDCINKCGLSIQWNIICVQILITVTCYNTDEPWKNHTPWTTPGVKDHIPHIKTLTVRRWWEIFAFSKYSTMTTLAFFLKQTKHTPTPLFQALKSWYGGSVALGSSAKEWV